MKFHHHTPHRHAIRVATTTEQSTPNNETNGLPLFHWSMQDKRGLRRIAFQTIGTCFLLLLLDLFLNYLHLDYIYRDYYDDNDEWPPHHTHNHPLSGQSPCHTTTTIVNVSIPISTAPAHRHIKMCLPTYHQLP
jgi:hypothetical protein